MIEQDTGQRRRTEDFTLHPENAEQFPVKERRRSHKQIRRTPGRSFLRKFRQPIIGLSLAGAAAPFIHAGSPHDAQQKNPVNEAQPTEADLARQAATLDASGKKMDAEDQVATRIADASQSAEQSNIVQEATQTYKIDSKLASDIYDVARQEGIEPKLAFGLVHTESSFKTHAESGVGARGLTQVMPKTASWLKPGTKANDLWEQRTNLTLGLKYLNQLIDRYHGNVHHALTAYNRGPGTVDKILRHGGNPDNGYAGKVLRGGDMLEGNG